MSVDVAAIHQLRHLDKMQFRRSEPKDVPQNRRTQRTQNAYTHHDHQPIPHGTNQIWRFIAFRLSRKWIVLWLYTRCVCQAPIVSELCLRRFGYVVWWWCAAMWSVGNMWWLAAIQTAGSICEVYIYSRTFNKEHTWARPRRIELIHRQTHHSPYNISSRKFYRKTAALI